MPGEGTGLGVLKSTGQGLAVAPDDQVTTDSLTAFGGGTLDTSIRGQDSIIYSVAEVGGVHGVTCEVQGALEDSDASYVSLKTYDETGALRAGSSIVIAASGTAYAILPETGGAAMAFRYYRVRIKSTGAGLAGTGRLRGFAK